MLKNLKTYFYGAAISFLVMVGICIALHPSIFKYYGYGISEFGAVRATVIPFFIGFATTIYCLVRIGLALQRSASYLSICFLVAAACLSGVAITSYPINRFTYDLHWWFAGALVLNLLLAIAWQIRSGVAKAFDYVLIAPFLVTVIMSGLPGVQHIPVFGDFVLRELIAFIASFWFLMRTTLIRVAARAADK